MCLLTFTKEEQSSSNEQEDWQDNHPPFPILTRRDRFTSHYVCFTYFKLRRLQVANCTYCKLHMLQIACVSNCMCCKLHGLQIAHIANCTHLKLYMLQIASVANCTCCKFHMLKSCKGAKLSRGKCANLPRYKGVSCPWNFKQPKNKVTDRQTSRKSGIVTSLSPCHS